MPPQPQFYETVVEKRTDMVLNNGATVNVAFERRTFFHQQEQQQQQPQCPIHWVYNVPPPVFHEKQPCTIPSFNERPSPSSSLGSSLGSSSLPLVFIDCEMTGLMPETDKILEVACLITDSELNPISEPISIVIHYDDDVLEASSVWCRQNLQELLQECRESKIGQQMAEIMLIDYIKKHVKNFKCQLAGNNIWNDRFFWHHSFKTLYGLLDFRMLDITAIKLCAKMWAGDQLREMPKKTYSHRALDDIHESIKELKFYRNLFFKQ